ncbi:MAG: recombination protein RecR [Parcubacteria group bacterium LiPW_15]|nr:MAG: recombination protein RecR [Parcubacteria group bacterium LiPW_15]
MIRIPQSLKAFIDELSDLPSIGPRQATRLAFHLVDKGKQSVANLADNLDKLKNIKVCARCFFIHENPGDLCDVCADKERNQKMIMIVEKETDLISIEQTKKYSGRYLVLGVIPKTGILDDIQKLRLQSLKSFIQKEFGGQAEEIILGFNPTSVGDWNAGILRKELDGFSKKITRLGRGLPTGGEIEFADDETLEGALEGRS